MLFWPRGPLIAGTEGGRRPTGVAASGLFLFINVEPGAHTITAFDPDTHRMYVPAYSDYTLVALEKPDARSNFDYIWSRAETPKIDGLSILKSPYGRVTAYDMDKG